MMLTQALCKRGAGRVRYWRGTAATATRSSRGRSDGQEARRAESPPPHPSLPTPNRIRTPMPMRVMAHTTVTACALRRATSSYSTPNSFRCHLATCRVYLSRKTRNKHPITMGTIPFKVRIESLRVPSVAPTLAGAKLSQRHRTGRRKRRLLVRHDEGDRILGPRVTGAGTLLAEVVLTSAEVYDPATGTWPAAGSLGTRRYGHTATLLTSLVCRGQAGPLESSC
jgi:hypothetical protein